MFWTSVFSACHPKFLVAKYVRMMLDALRVQGFVYASGLALAG